MNYEIIHNRAVNLARKYKTTNPFELAKFLNIEIIYKEMNNLKGFYVNMLKNNYVILNNNLNEIDAITTCAHELGHCRLHHGLGIKMFQDELCISSKTSIPEIEANYFAAELLIKDKDMLELLSYDYTYEQIAAELNAHTEIVIIKAMLLNKRGYELNVPYLPSVNYLGNK